jgi:hypothetical protein
MSSSDVMHYQGFMICKRFHAVKAARRAPPHTEMGIGTALAHPGQRSVHCGHNSQGARGIVQGVRRLRVHGEKRPGSADEVGGLLSAPALENQVIDRRRSRSGPGAAIALDYCHDYVQLVAGDMSTLD